jgi:hypothetical protein
MLEILHVEWFHTVHGAVVSFPNPLAGTRDEINKRYRGQRVLIEGNEYTVKGVETFAVERQSRGETIPWNADRTPAGRAARE